MQNIEAASIIRDAVNKIQAMCLYDASQILPAGFRDSVRAKFKPGFQSGPPLLEYLSNDATAGIRADWNAGHYWAEDTESGILSGELPKTVAAVFNDLRAARGGRNFARHCGTMAHLMVDAFVIPNLVDFMESGEVRARIIHDLNEHVTALPFLWEAIVLGQKFELVTMCADEQSIKIELKEYRQRHINICNGYLYGNGWPVSGPTLCKMYNKACNETAKAILIATEG